MALVCRAWLLVSFIATLGAAAHAAPVVDVTTVSPSVQCLHATELEEKLRTEALAATQRRLNVRIERAASGGWIAVLTVLDAAGTRVGERRIATPENDCRDLDAALVVVSAALLDAPEAVLAPGDASIQPTTEAAPATQHTGATRPAPRPANPGDAAPARDRGPAALRSPGDPPRAAFTFGTGVAVGALSEAVTRLHFGARLPLAQRWSVRGSIGFTPTPHSVLLETAEVRFSLVSARLLGCWTAADFARVRVDACAGGEPGLIVANTSGLERESSLLKPAFWGLSGLHAGYRVARSLLVETYVAGGLAAARHVYSASSTAGSRVEVQPTQIARLDLGLTLAVEAP